MKLAKIQSIVLQNALKSREFFSLSCYLNNFMRTPEGFFVSSYHTDLDMWNLRCALIDYLANEPESEKLFKYALQLTGKESIDFQVLNIVEL